MKHHYVFRKPGHPLHGEWFTSMRSARRWYAGWFGTDRTYLSPEFGTWANPDDVDDEDMAPAWCIYPTAQARDNDDTGANAMWIVRIPGSP